MFEEAGSNFDKPLGIDSAHFAHVLLGGLDQLVVDHPLRSFTEQRRARVDEHLLIVSDRSVTFGGVFFAAVEKESCRDCLSDLAEVFSFHVGASRSDWKLEALHDHHELLADVLSTLDCTSLDEILVAPGVLVAILFPSFVHSEQREMVSVLLVELGSLLISNILLLSWPIEHVLNRQHRDHCDYLVRAAQIHGS